MTRPSMKRGARGEEGVTGPKSRVAMKPASASTRAATPTCDSAGITDGGATGAMTLTQSELLADDMDDIWHSCADPIPLDLDEM